MKLLPIVFVLLFVVIAIAFVIKLISGKSQNSKYKIQPIMTGNEIEFFNRLQRALPDMHIFPQVAMSALIAPDLPRKSKHYLAAFGRIAQKRIDYVVCKKDMAIVCLVELDDRSHDAKKDQLRDAYTNSAGLQTIRWTSKSKPQELEIADAVGKIVTKVPAV